MKKTVAVFGSSWPIADDEDYLIAQRLGTLLADAGYIVVTGGYTGTMEAVSRGAAEAGGHVIGITSSQIEQYRPLKANQWVKEEIRFITLRERLLHLVTNADAFVALPGGVGTLAEVSLAWAFMQVGEIATKPIICLGGIWKQTFSEFMRHQYVLQEHQDLINFVGTPQEALHTLIRML